MWWSSSADTLVRGNSVVFPFPVFYSLCQRACRKLDLLTMLNMMNFILWNLTLKKRRKSRQKKCFLSHFRVQRRIVIVFHAHFLENLSDSHFTTQWMGKVFPICYNMSQNIQLLHWWEHLIENCINNFSVQARELLEAEIYFLIGIINSDFFQDT